MPTPRKTATPAATPKKPGAKRTPRKATTPPPARPSNDGPSVTGIAAKRAQIRGEDGPKVDPYAPTAWGSEDSSGTLVDLDLPSGQRVLAQRPGPAGLMAAGMLEDLDVLAGILPKVMGGKGPSSKVGKPGPAQDFDASLVLKNPKMLGEAMKLMDRVLVHVVVKPELTPEPENASDKERGHIYPSSVAMEDKVFIFNWATGGTRDIARFRQQHEASMASLDPGSDVVGTA